MDHAPRAAHQLMTAAPYTFLPEVSIFDAAGRLVREQHSGAPVVDAAGNLAGVITELDLIKAMSVLRDGTPPSGTVRQIMTPDPIVAKRDTSIYELAELFQRVNIRSVSVVEDGKLLGVVSRHDVLRALQSLSREYSRCQANKTPFQP